MSALLLSLFLAQANMGLTIPVPGVTPGPTYATNISNDLVLIDAHDHTTGKGVKVPTAGLNINANLSFNGFGATSFNSCSGSACGIAVPFLGTFVADAGDFAGLIDRGPMTALAGENVDGGLLVGGALYADAGSFEKVGVAAGVSELLTSTPLTLSGNAPATASNGVILNNLVTLTTGNIVSFQNNSVAKGSVDLAGKFLSNPGIFQSGVVTTSATLKGTAAAAGTETIMDGTVDVGNTGYITQFNAFGTGEFAITGRGHLIPLTAAPTAPAAGAFAACYGTVTAISLTGSDADMKLNFTTGTAGACANGLLLVTLGLANAYQTTNYNVFASYASAPTGSDEATALIGNVSTTSIIRLYAAIGFTPQTTTAYSIAIHTMAAGSAF